MGTGDVPGLSAKLRREGTAVSGAGRGYGGVSKAESGSADKGDSPSADSPVVRQGHQELREACHDMLQAVAAVQTLADAALAERSLQGPARGHVEKIAVQAEILADTVRQQLRQDTDDQKGRRLIELRRLISDVADGERVTYQGVLEVIGQQVPALVHAERDDIRRVLSNLVSNATRAAGPGGKVVIEVTVKGGLAEIVIDNTWPRFAELQEGTGLGWSIIAQRLSRIGGRLAYSHGSRGGIRATLSLPLAVYSPLRLDHATCAL